MGWVICRPHTPYTQELLNNIENKLDTPYENLKNNPSKNSGGYYRNRPFDKVECVNMYPLRWLEIMGEHFHSLMYKYKNIWYSVYLILK